MSETYETREEEEQVETGIEPTTDTPETTETPAPYEETETEGG
jgi:hypothetical protein